MGRAERPIPLQMIPDETMEARMSGRNRSEAPRFSLSAGRFPLVSLVALALVLVGLLVVASPGDSRALEAEGTCGDKYVAGGDHIPAGHEVEDSERYPSHLLNDHLATYGFCLFNIAEDDTTSASYITDGQLADTWNLRPDFITLTLGGENKTIVDLVTKCFDKVKDHDFSDANICAAAILGNSTLWTTLKNNLVTTFQQYRMIMSGRPHLIVAVTTYPNPYPDALDVSPKIVQLCAPLQDTIPTCTARWVQLPPALAIIDQVFEKLNSTISEAVEPFFIGSQGRFQVVDVYPKMRSHCMKMEVEIKTKVFHPPNTTHNHDSPKVNFGCSDPWFEEGSDGNKMPFYLDPAVTGILIQKSQTTKGMGIHPNDEGHKCISDLIWEWDTPEPGVTPLKWKLGVPEEPDSNICQ
jgi:hypothetical protein